MVRDTPPYGHAPTYQISLTYLKRQKCYGPNKKILFKKQLFDLEVKDQGPTKVITVRGPNFFVYPEIGQLYLVCGCMTIRQCVAYRNDLRETLTFDLKVKELKTII
jgi:hypothetical protein